MFYYNTTALVPQNGSFYTQAGYNPYGGGQQPAYYQPAQQPYQPYPFQYNANAYTPSYQPYQYQPYQPPTYAPKSASKQVLDLSTHFQGEIALNNLQGTSAQIEAAKRNQYSVQQMALGNARLVAAFARTQQLSNSDRAAIVAADNFFDNTVIPAQNNFQANGSSVALLDQSYALQQQNLQQYINVLNSNGGAGLKNVKGQVVTDIIYRAPTGNDTSSSVATPDSQLGPNGSGANSTFNWPTSPQRYYLGQQFGGWNSYEGIAPYDYQPSSLYGFGSYAPYNMY